MHPKNHHTTSGSPSSVQPSHTLAAPLTTRLVLFIFGTFSGSPPVVLDTTPFTVSKNSAPRQQAARGCIQRHISHEHCRVQGSQPDGPMTENRCTLGHCFSCRDQGFLQTPANPGSSRHEHPVAWHAATGRIPSIKKRQLCISEAHSSLLRQRLPNLSIFLPGRQKSPCSFTNLACSNSVHPAGKICLYDYMTKIHCMPLRDTSSCAGYSRPLASPLPGYHIHE